MLNLQHALPSTTAGHIENATAPPELQLSLLAHEYVCIVLIRVCASAAMQDSCTALFLCFNLLLTIECVAVDLHFCLFRTLVWQRGPAIGSGRFGLVYLALRIPR